MPPRGVKSPKRKRQYEHINSLVWLQLAVFVDVHSCESVRGCTIPTRAEDVGLNGKAPHNLCFINAAAQSAVRAYRRSEGPAGAAAGPGSSALASETAGWAA